MKQRSELNFAVIGTKLVAGIVSSSPNYEEQKPPVHSFAHAAEKERESMQVM